MQIEEVFLRKLKKIILPKKNSSLIVFHFQKKILLEDFIYKKKKPQAKIITVVQGKILDVVVDLRKKSPTYGKHFAIQISQNSDFSLYIPENFAHGFLCLSKVCGVFYKCTNYRHKESETTIKWDDPQLKINWKIKKPLLSDKDKNGLNFKDFK